VLLDNGLRGGHLGLLDRVWRDVHQLLSPTSSRKAFEIAANRRAHVVEVALLAHGGSFTTRSPTPARDGQRGVANAAVQTTASPGPRRP
jgi:hypothetical protein